MKTITLAALASLLTCVASASAAAPPSGTLSCSVFSIGSSGHPSGLLFRPFLDGVPRLVKLKGTNNGSSCDNSGVTGGKAPITGVAFKLTARMSEGTCAALTSPAPVLENARVQFKWRGVNAVGHFVNVATSKARIASTAYDTGTHTFTVTTEPLTGNAFVGTTVTLKLGFDSYVDVLEAGCPDGGLVGENFGEHNAATLDLQ